MLYRFLYQFIDDLGVLNVTRYITFRSIIALLSALFISFLLSPWFIRKLRGRQLGQVVRDDGPKSHFSKAGTPTMGGGLIIMAVLLPTLFWMSPNNLLMWLALLVFAGYGILGFWDDYNKVSKKSSRGVAGKMKLFWQITIASVACSLQYSFGYHDGMVGIPFVKDVFIPLGPMYVPFGVFVIVGASNAVNLTDGLDGLAIGPVMIAAGCFAILSYVSGNSVIAEYLNFPYIREVVSWRFLRPVYLGLEWDFCGTTAIRLRFLWVMSGHSHWGELWGLLLFSPAMSCCLL